MTRELPIASMARSEEQIRAFLVMTLASMLGIEPSRIDPDENWSRYGLGSTETLMVAGDLEEFLGREFSPELAYTLATVNALARELST